MTETHTHADAELDIFVEDPTVTFRVVEGADGLLYSIFSDGSHAQWVPSENVSHAAA